MATGEYENWCRIVGSSREYRLGAADVTAVVPMFDVTAVVPKLSVLARKSEGRLPRP
jgi:hypothetical protein